MKLSQPALSLLEETIKQAIGKYACGCEQTVVTDIHLQANQSSGEFSIFDDDDKELASTTIEEWMTYEGDDFYENMERILSNLLCNLKNRGAFDKLTIMKPFSFVLVDDDKETIAELLLLDDDTLLRMPGIQVPPSPVQWMPNTRLTMRRLPSHMNWLPSATISVTSSVSTRRLRKIGRAHV